VLEIIVCTRMLILMSTPCWDVPVHEAVVPRLDKLVSDRNLSRRRPVFSAAGAGSSPPHWFDY